MIQNQEAIPLTDRGGLIVAIEPGSIAEEMGLQPGDRVLAIGGVPLRDIIDYRFALSDAEFEMTVWNGHGLITCEIEKDPDEDLGIQFAESLFTPIRLCCNGCAFCFVRQMPPGLRSSLYVRDDDYRLSFLYGNFITLSNLDEHDWQRIREQHLSPLYISVHTTDQKLRASLMGKHDMPDVLSQIRRLGEMNIQVHTQIVACPGWNDGIVLQQTIEDLAACFPTVQSIAVVPVGLTRYHRPGPHSLPMRRFAPSEARALVDTVQTYTHRYQQRLDTHLVYPADEFFLLGQYAIPPASFYDGYPQYANGVGMTRDFLDEWARYKKFLPNQITKKQRVTLVSGTLFAPILQRILKTVEVTGLTMTVLPVSNAFFGEGVTVSGLLTGQDVLAHIAACPSDLVVLPRSMFDHTGYQTLDGYHLHDIGPIIGRPVAVVGTASEFVRYILNLAAPPPHRRAIPQKRTIRHNATKNATRRNAIRKG